MKQRPLLIIDVQNGFVNEHSRHIIQKVCVLARYWKSIEWPIYMSQFVNCDGSQWERLIGWSRLKDEEEIALIDEIADYANDATVFRKDTYTAAVDPFLRDLRREHWSEVVICGIATDSCVLATAIDLFELSEKLRPIVVRDACASQAGSGPHEAGLFLLGRLIGQDQMVDVQDLLSSSNAIGSDLAVQL